MKKALIICNAGMSSSLMADKTSAYFKDNNKDIEVDATTVMKADNSIEDGSYDLYLVSPQMKLHFDKLKDLAEKNNRDILQIPADCYTPIKTGIEKLADLIEEAIG
ncbi:PTS cellobiose transporter subunit IIB [Anaerococcus provencensis]|uniref:PTS cellobiose transporter subunit IIB n=1 Tax=Anaerococcus provencensis TaxID=938293 RepID=UPI0003099593|nr:PTS cellobiose transporter subunit IIB [Anaerococcus provencensis]